MGNWKILRINLADRSFSVEELGPNTLRRFLGGRGLGAYLLLKEIAEDTEPLGPLNKLIITTGVLAQSRMSGASRYSILAKSPLTGGFGESEAGGWWGPELAAAGFNTIILEGSADRPVTISIDDGKVGFHDAGEIWGKGNLETYRWLREKHGKVRCLQIGIGGENLVRYASIVNEIRHVHGRCGMGAVMGSKKVKAIVVKGSGEPEIADAAALDALREWHNDYLLNSFYGKYFREHGTPSGFEYQNIMGALPTRYFTQDTFEHAAEISAKKMEEAHSKGHATCYGCVLRCKPVSYVAGDDSVDSQLGGPEYETMAALGSLCGIDDSNAIVKANALASDFGLDSISLGNSIAFAMHCAEGGLLKKEDTDGMNIRFGNAEVMLQLVERIAQRQGIGDLLAEGVKRAGEKLGGKAVELALHVKGQEFPLHEPRAKFAQALGYAVNPAGADHNTAPHDEMYDKKGPFLSTAHPLGILEPVPEKESGAEKVRLYTYLSIERSLYNCLLMCILVGVPTTPLTLPKLTEIVQAVTGWEISSWELMKVGERAITMARLFNIKHGISSEADRLPKKMQEEIVAGPKVGRVVKIEEFERAKQLYYGMMGWDEKGIPTQAKLAELGLFEFLQNRKEQRDITNHEPVSMNNILEDNHDRI